MKRQITIYESAQNGKLTVFNDVECNTLGELKQLLTQKGINHAGMDFIEGVTNTKLLTDESRIPDNIPFKGKVTNNVFINILQKDAKIKSGLCYEELTRSELLGLCKPYADEIHEIYGKNYTQVRSNSLVNFLNGKDHEENYEEEKSFTTPIPFYEEKGNLTLENVAKAVVYIAEHLDIDVRKFIDIQEKSFFTAEDMQKFLSK